MLHQHQLMADRNLGQDVPEIMAHAARNGTDGFHLLGVKELGFQSLFGGLVPVPLKGM